MESKNFVITRILKILESQNISRYKLAQRADVQQSTISNIINRNTVPTLHVLKKICNGLGITLSQFFAKENELFQLTTEQKNFLKAFDTLNERQKIRLLGYIDGLKEK